MRFTSEDIDMLGLVALLALLAGFFSIWRGSSFLGSVMALPVLLVIILIFGLWMLARAGAGDALAKTVSAASPAKWVG